MRIWIDLANSPHVLFFRPLLRIFRERGHEVTLTARDFAQTVSLARKFDMDCAVIGRHGGANRLVKVFNLLGRAGALRDFAREKRVDLAVSHNSYAQAVAAWRLGIPCATLMDYEFQPANHVAFRLADRVIVPRVFPEDDLRRCGATPDRVATYDGLKEEIYLSDFEPRPGGLEVPVEPCAPRIGQPAERTVLYLGQEERVVVVLRPPPTMAAYHSFENPLFPRVLERLAEREDTVGILLARTPEQQAEYRTLGPRNVVLPLEPLDGPEAMSHADLVISAGGTMNREAAVLGTPAATIFTGTIGAVDRRLIEEGKVSALRTAEDVARLEFRRKVPGLRMRNPGLVGEVANLILGTLRPSP